jgi:hypothetical protein
MCVHDAISHSRRIPLISRFIRILHEGRGRVRHNRPEHAFVILAIVTPKEEALTPHNRLWHELEWRDRDRHDIAPISCIELDIEHLPPSDPLEADQDQQPRNGVADGAGEALSHLSTAARAAQPTKSARIATDKLIVIARLYHFAPRLRACSDADT